MTSTLTRAGSDPRARRESGTARSFWPRLLLGLLAAVIVFEVVWAFPVYLSLDPERSRSAISPEFPGHFYILSAHVITGIIALVTLFLQFLAPLRRHLPHWHRRVGWVYVAAGAVPTSAMGLLLLPPSTTPAGKVGLAFQAILWSVTAVLGLVRARQGRYREHRRLMLYSVAFAVGTSWGRITYNVFEPGTAISPGVHTDFGTWAGWFTNLLVVHLYLVWSERREASRRGPDPARGEDSATTTRNAVGS